MPGGFGPGGFGPDYNEWPATADHRNIHGSKRY